MGELRTAVNNNFMELGKQISDLCSRMSTAHTDNRLPKSPDQTCLIPVKEVNTVDPGQQQTFYQSIINWANLYMQMVC